jgi:hypothetical protein
VGEMWISKNEVTGEITLTPKDNDERPSKFNLLFKMIEETLFAENFLPPRDDAWTPDPFEDGRLGGVSPASRRGTADF